MLLSVLLLVLVVSAWSQTGASELLRYEASSDCMGGVFTVTAYSRDRIQLEAAVTESLEEARRIDQLLSNYKRDSEWSRVNRLAGQSPVTVSRELFDLLEACLRYSRQSEGTFDITVGPLMRRWGFFRGSGRFPHRSEIRTAMAAVGYQNIILDQAAQTVRFRHPQTEIDPGGVGKGYAVDRMVEILHQSGIESAFITAAGSSLYGLGAPPGQDGWPVVVRHPADPRRTVASLLLKNQSMATSGSSEKYFMAGGRIYSHIMDPRGGYPAQGTLSVSLVGPRAIDTEVWAKPFYILGRDWAARHKPKGMRVLHCPEGPKGQRWQTTCVWLP
ncbi:MAG: FAD:protein FMN transferase [Bryobacter sp.]|jgi:thiamine biosynthesis lipoprotein|nr:FAD:protein FMN transferase [Bryobacter sp. CoA8 C33]